MRTTVKVPLPQAFREETRLQCDGCEVVYDSATPETGWFRGFVCGTANAPLMEESIDFCPRCLPKMKRAIEQEGKAIRAEKDAALVDAIGIT